MKTTHVGLVLAAVVAAVGCGGGGGDTDGNGGALALGATTQGTLSSTDTYTYPATAHHTGAGIGDPWTVTLTPGPYTVRMCHRDTGTFDTYLEVYGPDNSIFNTSSGSMTTLSGYASNDDGAEGNQSLLRFTVVTGGSFTIVAQSFGGGAPSETDVRLGDYSIRIDSGDMANAVCTGI